MSKKVCVRCGTVPRQTDAFHRGIGAMSRVDNKTEICSDCGMDEAMQNFAGRECTPKSEWPVNKEGWN